MVVGSITISLLYSTSMIFASLGALSAFILFSPINPLLKLTSLVITFICSSAIMCLFDFYFLGLAYIIVYVGAIVILFLFVIISISVVPLLLFLQLYFIFLFIPMILFF